MLSRPGENRLAICLKVDKWCQLSVCFIALTLLGEGFIESSRFLAGAEKGYDEQLPKRCDKKSDSLRWLGKESK